VQNAHQEVAVNAGTNEERDEDGQVDAHTPKLLQIQVL
jgi:hypothetical protein